MTKKKTTKSKKITLTLRVTNHDEINALGTLCEMLKEKTYSGALMRAAKSFPNEIRMKEKYFAENRKLEEQLSTMADIISGYLDSQNKILALSKSLKQHQIK